eukprot:jgi/Galph1/3723/GphlegSOOS_G2397.1
MKQTTEWEKDKIWSQSSQEEYDWKVVWERVNAGGCASSISPCMSCGGVVHKVDDEILQLEAKARKDNQPTYVDPKTGYHVFTSKLLASRGFCCGNACRHCSKELSIQNI